MLRKWLLLRLRPNDREIRLVGAARTNHTTRPHKTTHRAAWCAHGPTWCAALRHFLMLGNPALAVIP